MPQEPHNQEEIKDWFQMLKPEQRDTFWQLAKDCWDANWDENFEGKAQLVAMFDTCVDFILSTERTKAREEGYRKGVDDALQGRIENMKSITIKETVNVPQSLRDYFKKEERERIKKLVEVEYYKIKENAKFTQYDSEEDTQKKSAINELRECARNNLGKVLSLLTSKE